MAFGWKVCNYWDSERPYSAIIDDEYGIEYLFGQFVFPRKKELPLVVFKTKRFANALAKTLTKKWGKTKVFPCEYITSDIVPEWALRYKVAKKLPISTAFAGAVRIF